MTIIFQAIISKIFNAIFLLYFSMYPSLSAFEVKNPAWGIKYFGFVNLRVFKFVEKTAFLFRSIINSFSFWV